jgi:cytoplasmic iron level regulating protein YaaA (DUF328/UPF0246 family)
MLTVLSPAKTLDYETPLPISKSTKPLFAAKSAELIDLLREYSPKQLAKLMSISDKLATLNVERYEAWEPKATKSNARQAILAFKGDVYQGLDAWSFKQADFDFAQDHLRMLSGLYGALRPLDLMQPYRLEMGTRLKNDQGKDLYDFWDFKDQKNGKYKIISFFAKKARGIMSGWIIRKKITDPKKLIKFAEAGYYYCPEESTDKNPVFYRDEK